MKKTMFKRIFAGIAAMFMMCLCLPMCSMEFMPNAEPNTEAEDEWLDMYRIEYKIKDRDTLIINDNSDARIELNGFYFKSYAADIKHLQIGNGWKIINFSYLTAIESLTIGDDCNIGESAFLKCTSLTSVKIGDGCNIGESAFWKCTSLTNVAFGDSCTIRRGAFDGCNSIQKVICKGDINTVMVNDNYNPEIIGNKEKWITPSKCPKCSGWVIDFKCESCGYIDEAAAQAESARLKDEAEQLKAEAEQLKAEAERIDQLIAQNTTEPPTTTPTTIEEGNTATTFSEGSILAIIGGSTFLILCGLAAVIIVKRRKKTQ